MAGRGPDRPSRLRTATAAATGVDGAESGPAPSTWLRPRHNTTGVRQRALRLPAPATRSAEEALPRRRVWPLLLRRDPVAAGDSPALRPRLSRRAADPSAAVTEQPHSKGVSRCGALRRRRPATGCWRPLHRARGGPAFRGRRRHGRSSRTCHLSRASSPSTRSWCLCEAPKTRPLGGGGGAATRLPRHCRTPAQMGAPTSGHPFFDTRRC